MESTDISVPFLTTLCTSIIILNFSCFFFKMFFDVGHFDVFIEFITVLLLLFIRWCFANRHVGP